MAMRFVLHLLTLLALLVAPLAAPAAASAPLRQAASDCKPMDMGSANHQMPASHHGVGQACCIAAPPAIDPPLTAFADAPLLDHPMFFATAVVFSLGAGPAAEDPPPRIA